MKKKKTLIICMLLGIMLLTSCGKTDHQDQASVATEQTSGDSRQTTEEPAETVGGSEESTEAAGTAQAAAEAQTAADLLKKGRTVVINLEGVELTVAQRSIDFIGGATYAINGSLQAVSNNIFIAAPDSIEVSGDLKSEIMNENTISPQLK